VSWHPNETDEVFLKLGVAGGDGLNEATPFALAPWAADLQDDLKDVNGRYDHLLDAWYARSFELPKGIGLRVTGGIIDSTDYLDDNTYSNDEYTQFMNEALVNGPQSFLPSYDAGGALELDVGRWSARGVVMNIGENDDGVNYTFFGAEVGYTLISALGEGTFRIIYEGGRNAFLDPSGTTLEDRNLVFLSFDQQFGTHVAGWLRFGWGDDDAAVDASNLYSGGLDIRGGLWGRDADNIGLGYAYFDGGNTGLERVQVAEAYYRLALNAWLALTADLQYQDNRYDDDEAGTDVDALTWGLRAVVEF
jgi:porin